MRARVAIFASIAAMIAACALLVEACASSYGVSPGSDASVDAPASFAAPDASIDGQASAQDAEAGPPCFPSAKLDAPFSTDFVPWVPNAFDISGYPKIATIAGSPAAVLLPIITLVVTDAGSNEYFQMHDGLWSNGAVPLQAFDVDAQVYVQCTGPSTCADGLIVAWLDTTNTSLLVNSNTGHRAGLPASTNGAAVVLDDYQNNATETNDPPAPSIQVVSIDATKPLGTYPWIVNHASASFLGAWHKVSIRVRGGAVSVALDGAPVVAATVSPVAKGLFGFTTGTGGNSDAVAIRDVHASFYACTP